MCEQSLGFMSRYVPFLKAKQNEIKSISELYPVVLASITPFFDFPQQKGGYSSKDFKATADRICGRLAKNLPDKFEFYFDNFDLDQEIQVNGKHNYFHLLSGISNMNVIPVVGLDRSQKHVQAVVELKSKKKLQSDVVAFRVCPNEFESFDVVESDIESDLGSVFELFEEVDLILDCRVCDSSKVAQLASEIVAFSRRFCSTYKVRQVIVTGSSIPASIGEVLKVESECLIQRRELEIFAAVKENHRHSPLVFGDYTTVSPNYSDVNMPPEMLQNVMTAKLTYTVPGAHYFIRGSGLKTNGPQQYFRMANRLCSNSFFRGGTYSSGDAYLEDKSKGRGSNCTPNAVIKP